MAAPKSLGQAVQADREHRWRLANDPDYAQRHREIMRATWEAEDRRRTESEANLALEPDVGATVLIKPSAFGLVPAEFHHRRGVYDGRAKRQPSGAWLGWVKFRETRAPRPPTPKEKAAQARDRRNRPDEEPRPLGRLEQSDYWVSISVPLTALEVVQETLVAIPEAPETPEVEIEGAALNLEQEPSTVVDDAAVGAFFELLANRE